MKRGARNHDGRQLRRSRENRAKANASERVLWEWLRDNKRGAKFRRQVTVGPSILDFYCSDADLCIEVDGEHHAAQTAYDKARDDFLQERGILTLRIPSLDLFATESPNWIAQIDTLIANRTERK